MLDKAASKKEERLRINKSTTSGKANQAATTLKGQDNK